MATEQTSTTSNQLQPRRQTWIFQSSPERYRIPNSLRLEQEEWWALNQHAKDVHVGDRVLIWISGKKAGIYAIGTVTDGPIVRPDSAEGMTYWVDPAEGRQEKPR